MRKVFHLGVEEITPTVLEVIEYQGMAGRSNLPARITVLLESALDLFKQLASPLGMFEDLEISNFGAIYDGNGLNTPDGPIDGIVPQADAVALFAATMGDALATKSSELFKEGGPTLGFMLDAVNSVGAERLGRLMGQRFLEHLPKELRSVTELKVQYYCPGHCGWHISGQEKLFQTLHPEVIGITLKPSWAMQPMKSISGILVAGDLNIHRFPPSFSFCPQCKGKKCVQRLRLLENSN